MTDHAWAMHAARWVTAAWFVAAFSAEHLEAQEQQTERDDLQEVVFSCDFESERWYQQWGEKKAPARTALVAADPQRRFEPRDGKALRIRVDQGGHNGVTHHLYIDNVVIAREAPLGIRRRSPAPTSER